ncbi:YceH family protein [Horticoccus sp. 23ND18S-11]|uniref:YceH family protein n=1 Tax=Horticoccus sp. 23ND18S-11 TaxID=3391832 RepID=UPI0039C97CEB
MDDPIAPLTAAEVRVLGSLIEKQITTPDYYPLTLNALTNACNQLTNREPVVAFDETVIVRAIDGLREKRLATLFSGAESRVAKYKHTLTDALLLTPAEVALLCVLMLRGPQTVGELRVRCERLFKFDTLPELEEALNALASRQPQPLVTRLPRQPGTKESRYTQLLSGPIESPAIAVTDTSARPELTPSASKPSDERLARVEAELAAVKQELATLKETFAEFRRQFE